MARANMAKSRANGRKKNSMVKLKFVVEKLQRSLSLAKRHASDDEAELDDQEHGDSISSVPDDVKEGHFAVIAFDDDGHPRRFIVPLSYLTHPSFVRLLEQAAEEYGFDHEGALTIPCRSSELENILADHQHQYYSSNQQRDANNNWGASSCETMVESC